MNARKKSAARDPSPRGASPAAAVVTYTVKYSEEAVQDLDAISDAATREVIVRRSAELRTDPLTRGKALTGDLKGYRSDRAAGQRYRIIYRVFEQAGDVVVVVIGIRKGGDRRDAYAVASRRVGTT